MLDMIGNMVLLCGVFASGILFIVINSNFTGDDDLDDDGHEK